MQALAKNDDQTDNLQGSLWLPSEAKPERDRILCRRTLGDHWVITPDPLLSTSTSQECHEGRCHLGLSWFPSMSAQN